MTPTRRQALGTLGMLAVPAWLPSAETKPSLRLSTFTVEVTPPIGHPCMGGGVAPVKEILDPLYAVGFTLTGLGKPIVFVAMDWCEIRNGSYDLIRQTIAQAVATEPVRVMLTALHQHDAPIADREAQQLLEQHRAKGAICDNAFVAKTAKRLAAAVAKAQTQSQPVTHIGTGKGRVEGVASNRRYLDEAGKVHYNRMSATRDPKIRAAGEGDIDPFVRALSFWNEDKPLAVVNAYATHPMSYYGRGGVTSDFVGLARKRRQVDTPDVLQMYISGCSGNVTAGKYNTGATENRPILADRIYKGMTAAWKDTHKTPIREAAFRSIPLTLSARSSKGFSRAELLERLKTDPRPFGQCLAALGLSWQQRVAAGQPIDLPVLDFGSAVLLILPAEIYVEFQLLAQKLRPASFVVVAGYGECGPGYIPIERAWKENDGNLSDWSWVDPGSEQIVTAALKQALNP